MKNIKRHDFILLIYAMLVLNFTNATGGTNPVLNIKGNGLANHITIKPSDVLSIKVDMDPGSLLGMNADWWIVAKTPSGNWYSWVYPSGWINIGTDLYGISVTYQGALFALNPFEVLSASNLAEGDYDIYFGVDTNRNGILDYQSLYYSTLKITVSSPAPTCTLPKVLQNGVCVTPIPSQPKNIDKYFEAIESSEDSFTLTASNPRHLSTSNYIDLTQSSEITAFLAAQFRGVTFWVLDATNAQNLINNSGFQGYKINENYQTGLLNISVPAGRWWIGATYDLTLSKNQSVSGFDEVSVVTLKGGTFINNIPMAVDGNQGAWHSQGFSLSGSPRAYIETEGTGGDFMVMTPSQYDSFKTKYPNGFTGGSYSYVYALGIESGGPATEIEGELLLSDGQYYLVWINTTGQWQGGAANIWIYQ